MAPNVAAALRLMLVTDDALVEGRDLIGVCLSAVRGGVTSVQLRLKHADAARQVSLARGLIAALPVPVLVNDRADVALAAGAAGVHLGPDDVPVPLIRRVAPPGFVIGASIGSAAEARLGEEADYWGVGPWTATTTKPDAGGPLGADRFTMIVRLGGGRPCIAIGGIRPEDLPAVRAAGGSGVAVVSGILAAPDSELAARSYADNWPG